MALPVQKFVVPPWETFTDSTRAYVTSSALIRAEKAAAEAEGRPVNLANCLQDREIPMPRPDQIPDGFVLIEMWFGVMEGNMRILVGDVYGGTVGRREAGFEKKGIPPEPFIVPGNAGKGKIIGVGRNCRAELKVDLVVIYFCLGQTNKWGGARWIAGYDAPHIMGTTSRWILVPQHVVLPAPDSGPDGAADAVKSLRILTSAHQVDRGVGALENRIKWADKSVRDSHTYSFAASSGAVSMGSLQLAMLEFKERGLKCRAIYISGKDEEHALLREKGIICLNRNDPEFTTEGKFDSKKLIARIMELTDGSGVDIWFDQIGGFWDGIIDATKSDCGGVVISGWYLGLELTLNRARSTQLQDGHDFVHYCPEDLARLVLPKFHQVDLLYDRPFTSWRGIPQAFDDFDKNKFPHGVPVFDLRS